MVAHFSTGILAHFSISIYNYGGRYPKVLWAGDETRQIEFMTGLYDSFGADEKPEWLTMEQIRQYASEMLGADS